MGKSGSSEPVMMERTPESSRRSLRTASCRAGEESPNGAKTDEKVVDAEFEEVDKDKK